MGTITIVEVQLIRSSHNSFSNNGSLPYRRTFSLGVSSSGIPWKPPPSRYFLELIHLYQKTLTIKEQEEQSTAWINPALDYMASTFANDIKIEEPISREDITDATGWEYQPAFFIKKIMNRFRCLLSSIPAPGRCHKKAK